MNFEMIDTFLLSSQGFTGKLDAQYVHLTSARQAEELLERAMNDKKLDNLDDITGYLAAERERQGFFNGFRMGVQLMIECTSPAPLDVWHPDEKNSVVPPRR